MALEHVDLALEAGAIAVVYGPSGGGKSTLLATAVGLLAPLGGRVERRARRVGWVPQQTGAARDQPYSVTELVLAGGVRDFDHFGRPTSEQRERAAELLTRLGLGELQRRAVRALSGGQRQRALVARALLARGELLVLDEPFSALDEADAATVLDLVVEAARAGAAVLVATHQLQLVRAVATSMHCVARGAVAREDAVAP